MLLILKIVNILEVSPSGMPLYEKRDFFKIVGDFSGFTMSVISIMPGERVPTTGYSRHSEDEYSYIINGGLDTFSNGEMLFIKGGDSTLIPAGEEHWCINNGDKPCNLVCFMVKKGE